MADEVGNAEQDDVSFLRTEDLICLNCGSASAGRRLALAGEGFGNRMCFLEDFSIENVTPNLTEGVFLLEQALSVRALQEMLQANDHSGGSQSTGHRTLLYGHAIKLRHYQSNMYLSCLSTSTSSDKLAFDVGLLEQIKDESCWWTINPASKQRSEGEKVRVGDDVILVSVSSERYLHIYSSSDSSLFHVNASFHQTLWTMLPISSGTIRTRFSGYSFGGEIVRLFHGSMDECLTIPAAGSSDLPFGVIYESGGVCSHARSLWRIEHTRTKWASGFLAWDTTVRIRHITSGRYMGMMTESANEEELTQMINNKQISSWRLYLIHRNAALADAITFVIRQNKDEKKTNEETQDDNMGVATLKFGDTQFFLQHAATNYWVSYETFETKKRGVGKVEEKNVVIAAEGHMDDCFTVARAQEEESRSAIVIRKCSRLFTKFIRTMEISASGYMDEYRPPRISLEQILNSLDDLIAYFAQPHNDMEHEARQLRLKALRNRQDLFQEEGMIALVLETIDRFSQCRQKLPVITDIMVTTTAEATGRLPVGSNPTGAQMYQNMDLYDVISDKLYVLLAALIKGNRSNCAQFAQSNRLDWLVDRLATQQASAGVLEVFHCILIDSPEALNMIKEFHIQTIISLLDRGVRDPRVLDVLCSLCVGNRVAVRGNQNMILWNLLMRQDLLFQSKVVDHVACMRPNLSIRIENSQNTYHKWYYEVVVDLVEQTTSTPPHMRIGWASTSGFKPFPGYSDGCGGIIRSHGIGDDLSSWAFDGTSLWTGGVEFPLPESPQFSPTSLQSGDVIGCTLNLSATNRKLTSITFYLNGNKVPGSFCSFSSNGSFYPVVSLSARGAVRFLLGYEHGHLRYGPPSDDYAPFSECLYHLQRIRIEPCIYFGDYHRSIFSGPAKQSEDLAFIPQPIDTSHVNVPNYIESLQEKLAENIHELWSMNKIQNGWRYADFRDDQRMFHTCLTTFEKLPLSEKQYDFNLALDSLKVILALGYKIRVDPKQEDTKRLKFIKLPNDFLQPNGYKPQPLDLNNIQLNEKLEKLIDKLGENIHNVWCRDRINQGWTYGLNENQDHKRSPHLIPYDMVDENIKRINKETASETVRTLLAYGYLIDSPNLEVDLLEHESSQIASSSTKISTPIPTGVKKPTRKFRTYRAELSYAVYHGKWYFEVEILTDGPVLVGWTSASTKASKILGESSNSYAFDGCSAQKINEESEPFGKKWRIRDIIGCFLDLQDHTVHFSLNGELLIDGDGSEIAFSHLPDDEGFLPAFTLSDGQRIRVNYGNDVNSLKCFTQCGLQEGYAPFCVNMTRSLPMWYSRKLPKFVNVVGDDTMKINVERIAQNHHTPPSLKIISKTFLQTDVVTETTLIRLNLPVICNNTFVSSAIAQQRQLQAIDTYRQKKKEESLKYSTFEQFANVGTSDQSRFGAARNRFRARNRKFRGASTPKSTLTAKHNLDAVSTATGATSTDVGDQTLIASSTGGGGGGGKFFDRLRKKRERKKRGGTVDPQMDGRMTDNLGLSSSRGEGIGGALNESGQMNLMGSTTRSEGGQYQVANENKQELQELQATLDFVDEYCFGVRVFPSQDSANVMVGWITPDFRAPPDMGMLSLQKLSSKYLPNVCTIMSDSGVSTIRRSSFLVNCSDLMNAYNSLEMSSRANSQPNPNYSSSNMDNAGNASSGNVSATARHTSAQGLLVWCILNTTTGILSFNINGRDLPFTLQVEPGCLLYPAVFIDFTAREAIQFELGRLKGRLPLSAALFPSLGKHLQCFCPPRLCAQSLAFSYWARAPNPMLRVHTLRMSEMRGWSVLADDATQMHGIYIPEDDVCMDILELNENEKMCKFYKHTLQLYEAVCGYGNNRMAHEVARLIDSEQLMYALKNHSMSGSLRRAFHDLVIALHLRSLSNVRAVTQTEMICPLTEELSELTLYQDGNEVTRTDAYIVTNTPSIGIRPEQIEFEKHVDHHEVEESSQTILLPPYFPIEQLKKHVLLSLIEAIAKCQHGALTCRDPTGGSFVYYFVPLLKLLDYLLVMGVYSNIELASILSILDPQLFPPPNIEECSVLRSGLGLLKMQLDEPIKLRLCYILQRICDLILRHKIEAIVSYSSQFVSDIQSDQKLRYNELKHSTLAPAIMAKKTKEFRCPAKDQMNMIIKMASEEDVDDSEGFVMNESLIESIQNFHRNVINTSYYLAVEESRSKEDEEAAALLASTTTLPDQLANAVVSGCCGINDGFITDDNSSVFPPKVDFSRVMVETVKRWANDGMVEDHDLIREMFALLYRQYNGIRELSDSLAKTYVIGSSSIKDVNRLLRSLAIVRSLLQVQMSSDEENIMRQSLNELMDNKVFYQHPELMRCLCVHETVMAVMVNWLNRTKQQEAEHITQQPQPPPVSSPPIAISHSEQNLTKSGQMQTPAIQITPHAPPSFQPGIAETEFHDVTISATTTQSNPVTTQSATSTKDDNTALVVVCCKFLCYFCRTSGHNQRGMFEHLAYLLDNSDMLLARPSLRGSCPLDVASSSLMDNNELALALSDTHLEKVTAYLSRAGLQSNAELLLKNYPDIGWDPVEGERFLDFLRFCVWVNGDSVEENANLVVRLLIRRPECLGPALRGEGGGLLRAIKDGINMSIAIAIAQSSSNIALKVAIEQAFENENIEHLRVAASQYNLSVLPPEDDEDYVDVGGAVLTFYSTLVDLLGKCAPSEETIKQGRSDSVRARAILRSLVSMEDLEGILSLRFIIPMVGFQAYNSQMNTSITTTSNSRSQPIKPPRIEEIISPIYFLPGIVPPHKSSVVTFLDRVYGVNEREMLFRLLENSFLHDMRIAIILDQAKGADADSALAINRYLGNSVLPLLIKHSEMFADAEYRQVLLQATLHTIYRLCKCQSLTKGQLDVVSNFLVAFTNEIPPSLMTKLLKKISADVSALTDSNVNTITKKTNQSNSQSKKETKANSSALPYTAVILRVLTLWYNRCGQYYSGDGSPILGTASEEERRLTMILFTAIFDALAKKDDAELFSRALPCLTAIGCSLSPDYSLTSTSINTFVNEESMFIQPDVATNKFSLGTPINVENISLTSSMSHIVTIFGQQQHDIWCQVQMENGWNFGDILNETERQHPNLVHYNRLNEKIRNDYEYIALLGLKVMMKIGWRLEKTGGGEMPNVSVNDGGDGGTTGNNGLQSTSTSNIRRPSQLATANDYSTYTPKPLDLSTITLTREMQRLVEILSENAHHDFVDKRCKYFEKKKSGGVHPKLVPYDLLTDLEKIEDRQKYQNLLKILQMVGYRLSKRESIRNQNEMNSNNEHSSTSENQSRQSHTNVLSAIVESANVANTPGLKLPVETVQTTAFGGSGQDPSGHSSRFAYTLLQKLLEYLDRAGYSMNLLKDCSTYSRQTSFRGSRDDVKFFGKVVLPLIEKYFMTHRLYFVATTTKKYASGYASTKEKEMTCMLFCKLASLVRVKFSTFSNDIAIAVRCLQALVRALDAKSVIVNSGEMVRASLLPFFTNAAEDLSSTVMRLQEQKFSQMRGTAQRGGPRLDYINMALLPTLATLFEHLSHMGHGNDALVDEIQTACYKILNALWILGTQGSSYVSKDWIIDDLSRHRALIGECLGHFASCFPVPFLEPERLHLSPKSIMFGLNNSNLSDFSLEAQDVMNKLKANLPDLPKQVDLIKELVITYSGQYDVAPHVVDVILPMLCSYLAFWWHDGPDSRGSRDRSQSTIMPTEENERKDSTIIPLKHAISVEPSNSSCLSSVRSKHLHQVLNYVLQLIRANFHVIDAPWMKNIAACTQSIIFNSTSEALESSFLPVTIAASTKASKLYEKEGVLKISGRFSTDADREAFEEELIKEYEILIRDIYAFFPLMMKYVDELRINWLRDPNNSAEELFRHVSEIFTLWCRSKYFKREELNYVSINNIDHMALINPNIQNKSMVDGNNEPALKSSNTSKRKKRNASSDNGPPSLMNKFISLNVACVKRLLAVGVNMFSGKERELMQITKQHLINSKIVEIYKLTEHGSEDEIQFEIKKDNEETIEEMLRHRVEQNDQQMNIEEKHNWQRTLYMKIGDRPNKEMNVIAKQNNPEVKKERIAENVRMILRMAKVLFYLHMVEHPHSRRLGTWKRLITSQRKRAVVACFRMAALHSVPKHRAINLFLNAYHQHFLQSEENRSANIVSHLHDDANVKKNRDGEEKTTFLGSTSAILGTAESGGVPQNIVNEVQPVDGNAEQNVSNDKTTEEEIEGEANEIIIPNNDPLKQLIKCFARSANLETIGESPSINIDGEGTFAPPPAAPTSSLACIQTEDELFVKFTEAFSDSCVIVEEDEDDEKSLEESEMEKLKLLHEQGRLAHRGAAEMMLLYISACNGEYSEMLEKTINLGISLLHGGNTNVQARMLHHLQDRKDMDFFISVAGLMSQCSVLDLDTFERGLKAEALGVGADSFSTATKNLSDSDFTCALFRFLQLLCEGHNLDFQNYLRSQPGNNATVNIIVSSVDYLLRLQESIMDFYWHYSGKETVDCHGKDNFCRAITVASQVFNTLTEYVQGPCLGNQLALAHSRLWDAISGFLYIFAHMQHKLSKDPKQIELLRELMNLQKDMIVMLLSMLEGNVMNGPIGKQMVDTLVESQANLEMVLKFFDIFLKMKDLTTSESFKEFDANNDGFISPKEFRQAMEAQKMYTSDEIDYILTCVDVTSDGKIDIVEFTERFHNPAKEIGFNLAVLLTNLSEHISNDLRMERIMKIAGSFLTYFESNLGRIEIMGGANRIERVYFEIKESHIEQWNAPQIKESKRQFLYEIVTEGDDKEKMEAFVNFCEDTIFEMKHAAALIEDLGNEGSSSNSTNLPVGAIGEPMPSTDGNSIMESEMNANKTFFSNVKSTLSPTNLRQRWNQLSRMSFTQIFTVIVAMLCNLGTTTVIMLIHILLALIIALYTIMKGEDRDSSKSKNKRHKSLSQTDEQQLVPIDDSMKQLSIRGSESVSRHCSKQQQQLEGEIKELSVKTTLTEINSSSNSPSAIPSTSFKEQPEDTSNNQEFVKSFLAKLARNFYKLKYTALTLVFTMNFLILFYEAQELDDEEIIIMPTDYSYIEMILRILALTHSIVSLCMVIAYYMLKVPLVIFKQEKDIARRLEFDGFWILDDLMPSTMREHWDKLAIKAPSFPECYWDKFVKKRVRTIYKEQSDHDYLSDLLGLEKEDTLVFEVSKPNLNTLWDRFKAVDWLYQIWKWGVVFTDHAFLYTFCYFLLSVLGNFNYFFFACHLLDIATSVKALSTIMRSITHNGKQLLLTLMLMSVVVYMYSVLGFTFFRKFYAGEDDEGGDDNGSADDDDDGDGHHCKDMLTCFIFHVYEGLRAGGGIGDTLGSPQGDPLQNYRIGFDMTFFFFVIVILLAIIQGLIIDAFGELRGQLEQVKEDLESECFICGIGKDYFDKVPHGFETHTMREHNFANYMFFLMHLINKPDTEHTGQETFVWQLYQKRCWDFFPVGDCFRKQYEGEISTG
ncbi:hypothetical protein SNEBB_011471 [Seison nebaliae]|nr:hypothetical protein SNEBB_011471 [Seison nebaliae]